MSKNETQLIDYKEVLKEIESTKPNNHLLLGNGFNLSLGVRTSYKNIFRVMRENNRDFDSIISDNFDLEKFIGECKSRIAAEDNPYLDFMETYFHNKIKLDFMKAVTQIVTKEVKNIYQEKNEEIYVLLQQFDTFYTLNYDPFLYLLVMTYKEDSKGTALVFQNTLPEIGRTIDNESQEILQEIRRGHNSGVLTININNVPKEMNLNKLSKADFKNEMRLYFGERFAKKKIDKVVDLFWQIKESENTKVLEQVDDGFRLFGNELTFQSPRTQNLFFLHGAFHLIQRGKSIYKITQQSEKALYQRLEEVVEEPEWNVICVFSDTEKEIEISHNEYLRKGLAKLATINGTMLIIGSSLAENDAHIFRQINASGVDRIFISSSEESRDTDFKKAKKLFDHKEILLFDRYTMSYARNK